jgi:hypothetical protein
MKLLQITSVAQNPKNSASVRLNFGGDKHLWVNEVVVNPTLQLDRINLGTFNDLCAMGGYQLEAPNGIEAHSEKDEWVNAVTGETGEYKKAGFHAKLEEGEFLNISATANPTAMGLKFQLPQNRVGASVSSGSFTSEADEKSIESTEDMD